MADQSATIKTETRSLHELKTSLGSEQTQQIVKEYQAQQTVYASCGLGFAVLFLIAAITAFIIGTKKFKKDSDIDDGLPGWVIGIICTILFIIAAAIGANFVGAAMAPNHDVLMHIIHHMHP